MEINVQQAKDEIVAQSVVGDFDEVARTLIRFLEPDELEGAIGKDIAGLLELLDPAEVFDAHRLICGRTE